MEAQTSVLTLKTCFMRLILLIHLGILNALGTRKGEGQRVYRHQEGEVLITESLVFRIGGELGDRWNDLIQEMRGFIARWYLRASWNGNSEPDLTFLRLGWCFDIPVFIYLCLYVCW